MKLIMRFLVLLFSIAMAFVLWAIMAFPIAMWGILWIVTKNPWWFAGLPLGMYMSHKIALGINTFMVGLEAEVAKAQAERRGE